MMFNQAQSIASTSYAGASSTPTSSRSRSFILPMPSSAHASASNTNGNDLRDISSRRAPPKKLSRPAELVLSATYRIAVLPRRTIRSLTRAPQTVQFLRLFALALVLWAERLTWERWRLISQPSTSTSSNSARKKMSRPLRLLLVADPQLVDEHTYEDVPKRLGPVVRWAADTFVRRAFKGAKRSCDGVVWLGDLFDGGRREMSDESWKKFRKRFDRLFTPRAPSIYIPGNHDLGLGPSPSIPVDAQARQRYIASFGTRAKNGLGAFSNLKLGKWSGASRPALGLAKALPEKPREEQFELVDNEGLRKINVIVPIWAGGRLDKAHDGTGDSATLPPTHEIILLDALALARMRAPSEASDDDASVEGAHEVKDFLNKLAKRKDHPPRVLMTHIPLYRPAGTPCNLAGATHGVTREARSSLREGEDAGHTYKNEIGQAVSRWVLESVRPSVVFSGDDHDHCEMLHDVPEVRSSSQSNSLWRSDIRNLPWLPPNKVPELTLKGFAMTDGIRHPGYALLHLYPPSAATTTEEQGASRRPTSEAAGIHYAPYLLPDQILIWTHVYAGLAVAVVCCLALLRRMGWRDKLLFSFADSQVTSSKLGKAPGRAKRASWLPLYSRAHAPPNDAASAADRDDWEMVDLEVDSAQDSSRTARGNTSDEDSDDHLDLGSLSPTKIQYGAGAVPRNKKKRKRAATSLFADFGAVAFPPLALWVVLQLWY
ncbi:hypothetical protein IE81DRAFT_347167 [Ceraceosorus guamensis]|uniref:Calcineurin-like phosphoesterase domain-containing protein n=1 Tax=Ceraceosorus guamensis TaxID=1522189 RepID=A0A316VZD7_9BASI|nr:hypothetical protein IE81DRAFT_347167 [Ceraceosorus guamensis]PWN42799.1 hypothetical protein IE81DRAFT_347167 [Ceraceosorus guamensis]